MQSLHGKIIENIDFCNIQRNHGDRSEVFYSSSKVARFMRHIMTFSMFHSFDNFSPNCVRFRLCLLAAVVLIFSLILQKYLVGCVVFHTSVDARNSATIFGNRSALPHAATANASLARKYSPALARRNLSTAFSLRGTIMLAVWHYLLRLETTDGENTPEPGHQIVYEHVYVDGKADEAAKRRRRIAEKNVGCCTFFAHLAPVFLIFLRYLRHILANSRSFLLNYIKYRR